MMTDQPPINEPDAPPFGEGLDEDRRPRRRRMKLVAVLPTLLTLANAACGFASLTVAAKIGVADVAPELLDERVGDHLFVSALLIFAAMVFDAFDGSAARLLGQNSEFGAQLDSLCDAVSFGVAPAFLMLQLVRHTFAEQAHLAFEWPGRILWAVAALYVLCAILRLARFNVETEEDDSHEFFSGLPSPAAAATVASVPLVMDPLREFAADPEAWISGPARWLIPAIKILLPLVTLAAAGLMVSKVRYPHLVNNVMRGRRSRGFFIALLFGGAAVLVFRELAVPVAALGFAFAAPVRGALRRS